MRGLLPAVMVYCSVLAVYGCAPVRGFPADPAEQADLSSIATTSGGRPVNVPIYGPASEADYDAASGDTSRAAVRNKIIRLRLAGYDQTYSAFKRGLTAEGNLVSAGGSLAALVLGGVAATTGSLGASNALAAAGAGLVGAQGVINRDLFFQKTLPALIAQMDAARDRALKPILDGMKQPDSAYSLTDANEDLQRLKDAGSIEGAINTVNQDAANAKQDAQAAITRTPDYVADRAPRVAIGQRLLDITALAPAVTVALANAMVAHLDTASPAGRAAAQRILPPGGRFAANQANRARQFLRAWADQETMTPERAKLWSDEIERASNPGG